ncbi:MerR family transcriptional regulator [Falsirhodobacter sp. 1013]|uniref:MerR family transcriptional regulator n=1 Tax=Falsirhodobacter sp. 1013 TaxID=3417566 RepID=UPI003EBCCB96
MEKSADAFRTISEVADVLQTPAHVLRFWESRFPQIKPVKRAGGRRYYRPSDIALLGGIRKLLHDDGMTIRGVQKILREQGVRRVAEMARVEEAGFIEVEPEDILQTAEVHAFPQRRAVSHVSAEDAGWTFTPASDSEDDTVTEEEFFSKVEPKSSGATDDAAPPPLGHGDAALARERAERLRDPSPKAPVADSGLRPLISRLLALEPGSVEMAEIQPLVARLTALRDRMTLVER